MEGGVVSRWTCVTGWLQKAFSWCVLQARAAFFCFASSCGQHALDLVSLLVCLLLISTQKTGSSALSVLSLQPVFVENDGGKCFPNKSSARCFFRHMLQFTFAGFEIQYIASSENLLTITARALTPTSACPSCSQASNHVHSYYTRSPQDLPISGRRVHLVVRVRRFRCPNPQCSRQTVASGTGFGTANEPMECEIGKDRRCSEWPGRLTAR